MIEIGKSIRIKCLKNGIKNRIKMFKNIGNLVSDNNIFQSSGERWVFE